jgi:hypothetical protein
MYLNTRFTLRQWIIYQYDIATLYCLSNRSPGPSWFWRLREKSIHSSQSQQTKVVRRRNDCLSTNYLQRYRFSINETDDMALGVDLA